MVNAQNFICIAVLPRYNFEFISTETLMPNQATPRETLIDLVGTILKGNGIDKPVDVQADLVNQGLPSVDMVHLMLAIEAAFDITIPQSGLTPENFRSITTIEAMLAKLTAPAEASS